jgi:hypothetical protein
MTNDPNNVNAPVPAAAQVQPPTVAEQIWSEIKDKDILMFALPAQKVSNFCQPVPIDPSRCFLVAKATAALPSLEAAVGPEYECTMADKYIIIARKLKNTF